MRYHYYILLILLSCCSQVFGQNSLRIYNDSGRVIAIPEHKISKEQLKRIAPSEDTLIKQILNNIHYPEYALEEGRTDDVFVSFCLDKSDTLSNIKILRSVYKDIQSEVIRALKDVRVAKTNNAKKIKGANYFLRIRFVPSYQEEISHITNGYFVIPVWQPLKPKIKSWLDSIGRVLNGKSYPYKALMNERGRWKVSSHLDSINLNTSSFGLVRCQYPSCHYALDDGCCSYLDYDAKKKKLTIDYETIWFMPNDILFLDNWGSGQLLRTTKDTLYHGGNECINNPAIPGKYLIFISSICNQSNVIFQFVIGQTLETFPKDEWHYNGGALVKGIFCQLPERSYIKLPDDSTINLFFNTDTLKKYKPGDTLLLSVDHHYLTDQHCWLEYSAVLQIYHIRPSQIEQYFVPSGPFTIGREYFHEKNLKGKEAELINRNEQYNDPVFRYLYENNIVHKLSN